ncbi:MAG: C2 family cysteine protease [Vulcanimicrobiota bacterium]
MPAVNPALRQQISQAFVSHRLNNSELVAVTQRLRECEAEQRSPEPTQNLLKKLSQPEVDMRSPVSLDEVKDAVSYLRLDGYFNRLSPDKPWTPYERALYRRLSALENDPVPLAARPESKGSAAFAETVKKNFNSWDLDGDGALSNVELDQALANPDLKGEAAAAAVVLRRQSTALQTCASQTFSGVTVADLVAFTAHGVPDNAAATFKINMGYKANCVAAAQMRPAPDLMSENFDPLQVEQGRAGSCVYLSTQSGVVPEKLKDMFEPLADGTINVHFADGDTQNVRDLTLAERLYHAKSPNGGRWPGLMEVAIGQRIFQHSPKEDGSFRSAANGINPEEASQALHGRSIARVNLDEISLNDTRKMLISLMECPQPWLAGSRKTIKGQDSVVSIEDLHNGIHNNHAYSIQAFEAASDTITLRNPWRHGEWVLRPDGKDDGTFSMPLKDFYASYFWVSVPNNPATSGGAA